MNMWTLAEQVVVAVVVMVANGVSAAPGVNQGRTIFSNTRNNIGFKSTNKNNNNYNSGHSTYSLGYNTGGQRNPSTGDSYGVLAPSSDLSYNSYMLSSGYGTAAVDGTESSPALSALALLGFLYFLNLIQDVLQNNTIGRRKRSLMGRSGKIMEEEAEEEEEEGRYITSYLEEEPVKGGERSEEEEKEEEEARGWSEGRELRPFSFLEDFFIRLPQALGMRKREMIDRISADGEPLGVSGFLASRLKMVSSIMSFLQNPSPSRIRRSPQDIEEEESLGKDEFESFTVPSLGSFVPLLAEVFKDYLPFSLWSPGGQRSFSQEGNLVTSAFMEEERELKQADEETKDEDEEVVVVEGDERKSGVRRRRHSPTAMNAWYSELGGRNKEPGSGGVGGVAAKAISLLGGSDVTQQAVKQEAAPALLELSKGLTGAQPHCLQRVLCRLTSHARHLSLLPRMALHMLSSNMKNESEEAMKAGLRGENCSQTFAECDIESKAGKT